MVVCFDERPCFLIGEEVAPLPLQSGHVRKEHYAYEKNGACALLAAIEPLTKGYKVGDPEADLRKRDEARIAPISGYLEFDAQPPRTIP
jgi:hypothetical protein